MKSFRYALEACLIYTLYAVFKLMPVDWASGTGGFLARSIGPRLAASRKARRHLEMCFPRHTDTENTDIIRGMWDNLGRVAAEYPHLKKIALTRVEMKGDEHIAPLLSGDKQAILFTGHLANWEVPGSFISVKYGMDIDLIYREPNNPWARKLLDHCRKHNEKIRMIAKSHKGARDTLVAVKEKRNIGILIDQKYNEGVPALFLGHPAMTSTAFVDIGQKYDYLLIPFQIERLKGANFRITLHEPLATRDKNDTLYPVEQVIEQSHKHLENWINQNPEQWLWIHKRWSDKAAALYEDKMNKKKSARHSV